MLKLLKLIRKFFKSDLAPIIGNLILGVILLTVAAFKSRLSEVLYNALFDGTAISIVLIGAIGLISSLILVQIEKKTEESEKENDNHHGIIIQYSSDIGSLLNITNVDFSKINQNSTSYHIEVEADKHCEKYDIDRSNNIEYYRHLKRNLDSYFKNKKLPICSIDIFTNNKKGENGKHDTHIDFNLEINDKSSEFKIPDFIINNANQLMDAHKTSSTKNYETIRLDDCSFVNNTLKLSTSRTNYNTMLITNRCLDYELTDKVTIREIYEFRDYITPLPDSKLSNQIGIEGLILIKDGDEIYTLIEKRKNNERTVWRDKFSMPISLSLKKKDLGLRGHDTLPSDSKEFEIRMKKVIQKFVYNTYGIKEDKYSFDFKKNLMGIARDLIEGGKPNFFFYIIIKKDDCTKFVEYLDNVNTENMKKSALNKELYLCPINDIKIDFNYNYSMKFRQHKEKGKHYIYRAFINGYGSDFSFKKNMANFSHGLREKFKGSYKKMCGEALLGCLAYYELCKDRIEYEINNMEESK